MNMTSEDPDKGLPPLAPGPRGPITLGSTTVARPKKNSTACQSCKQAKRKCSGRPAPCKSCKNAGAECVFDETLDLRRKVAAKRNLEELSYYRNLLYSLLEALRSSNEEKVNSLLELIRGSPSLNSIATAVEAPTIDPSDINSENHRGSSEEASLQISSLERLQADVHSRITLEKLCDIPLFQVPARPWTTVTDDDHLISHLVSLYFTWDHPLSQVIDQKIFLRHMKARDTKSEFCTPFLVNSILAMASTYSDFPDVFAVPGDLASRGQHFLTEAERLWKVEEGQISLANIQGLVLMSYVLKYQGKNRVGWLMLKQAVQLAQDFGLFQVPRVSYPNWKEMSADMQHVGAITAWGIFILNSQMTMELHKVADLKPPISSPYMKDTSSEDIAWSPYPRTNQLDYVRKPALLRYTMVKLADLTETVVEIQDLLFETAFDKDVEEVWIAAQRLCSRLEVWLTDLKDATRDETQPMPQTLFLHIRCHQTIMSTFKFFSDHEDSGNTQHPSLIEEARSFQLRSAKEISYCLYLYREIYGLVQIPRHLLEAVNSSAVVLLTGLHTGDFKDAFVETCRYLVAFSRRFTLAKNMIHGIEYLAQCSRIDLPPEALAVLGHSALGER